MRLYEIVNLYQAALDWMEEEMPDIAASGGEIPKELASLLDEAESDFETKVQNLAFVIRDQSAKALAIKSEIDQLAKKHKAANGRADYLKKDLHDEMLRAKINRVDGEVLKVGIRINSAMSISLLDPEKIPQKFRKVTVTFKAREALAALKEDGKLDKLKKVCPGVMIDGIFKVSRGSHLRIW